MSTLGRLKIPYTFSALGNLTKTIPPFKFSPRKIHFLACDIISALISLTVVYVLYINISFTLIELLKKIKTRREILFI